MRPRYSFCSPFLLLICILMLAAFRRPERKLNIVFIGDSITEGAHQMPRQPSGYAIAYLRKKLEVVEIQQANEGYSGRTTLDFLPCTDEFKAVTRAADQFYKDTAARLVFSVMLGTNDSAIKGTQGAPVSAQNYGKNLALIMDTLIRRYPDGKIVLHHPTWYSPNTYNNAMYLAEGLERLQSYTPERNRLIERFQKSRPGHLRYGDRAAFAYLKALPEKLLTGDRQTGYLLFAPQCCWSRSSGSVLGQGYFKGA